ncbi:hypothetical protein REPUB_Repub02eG0085700 [Reevesia pubescens]
MARKMEFNLQQVSQHMSVNRVLSNLSWTRPPEGFLKVNVDGTFDQRSGCAGLGVVCRDYVGNIRFSGATKLVQVKTSMQAEVLAIK